MIRKKIRVVLLYLFVITCISLINGCAVESAPTGGAKDTSPPILESAKPENESLRFKEDKIVLKFDEYITSPLNVSEIYISPEMNKKPDFFVYNNKVTIKLNDTLQQNTTYTINFGKSITDVNERNVLENLSYIFCTGDSIDKSSISGIVIDAKTLKPLENVIVGLYKDSVAATGAVYFYKTKVDGFWKIDNVKESVYYIIGFEDKNGNKKFDKNDASVAFLDKKIEVKDTIRDILLIASENISKPGIKEIVARENYVNVVFNKAIEKLDINFSPKNDIEFALLNEERDTLKIWLRNKSDTIKICSTLGDTVVCKTIKNKVKTDSLYSKKNIQLINSSKKDIVIPYNNPLKSVAKSKVIIKSDTLSAASINFNYKIKDNFLFLEFEKKEEKNYWIDMADSALVDIFDNASKAKRLELKTGRDDEYGNLVVSGYEGEEFIILELYNEKESLVERAYINSKLRKYTFYHLEKGKYKLIAVEDKNKNGYWDGGNIFTKTQPEQKFILNDEVDIKGGWDVEVIVKLTKENYGTNKGSTGKKPGFRK